MRDEPQLVSVGGFLTVLVTWSALRFEKLTHLWPVNFGSVARAYRSNPT